VLAGLDPAVASPTINQYERGKHEPQLKRAKRLAEVLGIPPAFLYTEDDVLAELLLRWNDLTLRQKKDLLKQAETARPPQRVRKAK
jgi:transcriptional regulator with XRE-family HTH domain